MAERNRRNPRQRSYRDTDYFGSRQAEQFQDSDYGDLDQRERFEGAQMGETGGRPSEAYYYEETTIMPPRSARGYGSGEGYSDYGRGEYGNRNDYGGGLDRSNYEEAREGPRSYRGGARYDTPYDRGFQPFTSEDQGGRDFVRGGRGPYGGYGAGYGGGYSDYRRTSRDYRSSNEPAYGYRGDYGPEERGFFERAGDEIASWFGDEDAARRRRMDHRGRGPENYTRSDERILEDACDSLTDDWAVDARNVQVTVKDGEVTLDGTVESRSAKRRAEDCVDTISGVRHVQNNLRVQDRTGEYVRSGESEETS